MFFFGEPLRRVEITKSSYAIIMFFQPIWKEMFKKVLWFYAASLFLHPYFCWGGWHRHIFVKEGLINWSLVSGPSTWVSQAHFETPSSHAGPKVIEVMGKKTVPPIFCCKKNGNGKIFGFSDSIYNFSKQIHLLKIEGPKIVINQNTCQKRFKPWRKLDAWKSPFQPFERVTSSTPKRSPVESPGTYVVLR